MFMMRRRVQSLVLFFILFLLAPAGITESPGAPVRSVTVPLHFTDNRVFIDLTLLRADGKLRTARFWVDTGGGGFLMTELLARDVGLDFAGAVSEEQGEHLAYPKSPPQVRLANMSIDMKDVTVAVVMGKKSILPGIDAEGMLPGHLLARYQVVIDYPAREFTLALPGTLKMKGTRFSTPVSAKQGFVRLEARIEGKPYGFLLDSGASYTMVSQRVLDEWRSKHPDWPLLNGAVGTANMIGRLDPKALIMRIPSVALGPLQITTVGVVSRSAGTFETGMSPMMTAPIVGAIAGNVLRGFRVQIDYAQDATYLEQTGQLDSGDLDTVPLVLDPQEDGTYVVSGVARQAGKSLIEEVTAGDRLLKVSSLDVTGKSLGEVLDALHGAPGQTRNLVLERNGKQITVSAPVIHLL